MSYTKSKPWGGRVFECEDCGAGPDAPMFQDAVWLTIARRDSLLCCGCTEKRLGRPWRMHELKVCPMNGALLYWMEKHSGNRG